MAASAVQEGGCESVVPSPEALFAAWLAEPKGSAEAQGAAEVALEERAFFADKSKRTYDGWLPLGKLAFAELQKRPGSGEDLLLLVAHLAQLAAQASLDPDTAQLELPPAEAYAAWVIAMLADHGTAGTTDRHAAVELFSSVVCPGRHRDVATAAALELVRTSGLGEPDRDALITLTFFSNPVLPDAEGDEACACAIADVPGCCAVLIALAANTSEVCCADFVALKTLCKQRRTSKQLLDAGVVETCLANAVCSSTERWCQALGSLTCLLGNSEDAWPAVSVSGACFRVLHAPSLRPGCWRVGAATLGFLHAAAAASSKWVKGVPMPPRPTSAELQTVGPAARHVLFHRRAMYALDTARPFWNTVMSAAASAPHALAAMAYAHHFSLKKSDLGILWPLISCLQREDYGDGESERGNIRTLVAYQTLLQPSWPLAPLIMLGGEPLEKAMSLGSNQGSESYVSALYDIIKVCGDDTACAMLGAAPPGPLRLAASVSCALLAPFIPHLGALLAQLAHERVPILVDAYLDSAAQYSLRAADDMWAFEECERDASRLDCDAAYRFNVLCAALGTLVAEAYPSPDTVPPALLPATTRAWREDSRLMLKFRWRRYVPSQKMQTPAHNASNKRQREEGDAVGTAGGSGGLLSADDVGVPLRGSVPFLVGGHVVHALALAMERVSPVLAEALQVADASGKDAATGIVLPPIADVSPDDHAELFRAAVEHTYTGSVRRLSCSKKLTQLWRIAHLLDMARLKRWCARALSRYLRARPAELFASFELSQSHCCFDLEKECSRGLLVHLGALAIASQQDSLSSSSAPQRRTGIAKRRQAATALTSLAEQRPKELRAALIRAVTDALHELFGAPPSAPEATL